MYLVYDDDAGINTKVGVFSTLQAVADGVSKMMHLDEEEREDLQAVVDEGDEIELALVLIDTYEIALYKVELDGGFVNEPLFNQ